MIAYRLARPTDAARIADLHTRSWQTAYRGILPDTYLDHEAPAERLGTWRERFTNPAPNQRVLLAEEAGTLVGFIALFLDEHPELGTLVDNLHADPARKGQGIGSGLLREAARSILPEATSPGFYLTVFEQNRPAIQFYERMGGVCVAHTTHGVPGGALAAARHYAWPNGSILSASIR
ncbi:N-acetyltransferase family protein [Fibrella sp. WM1]|uniref:GNAT family N-acetyltransferase n=1 Tax=Fibrella musci TaxID=3242485 RepID=UPI003520FFB7